MTTRQVQKVVIVGRDIAAWLSAVTLQKAFGDSGLSVEVAELPGHLHPQDSFSTLPAWEPFHRRLGLTESAAMRACAGTFSLGQAFANFHAGEGAFFHGFGSHGGPIGFAPFYQNWLRARAGGLPARFEDFSINATAAKAHKIFVPSPQTDAYGRSEYAYNLSAGKYAALLRAYALSLGVTSRPVRAVEVHQDQETGAIRSVMGADGLDISGDLFIDASGAERRLISRLGAAQKAAGGPVVDRIVAVSAGKLATVPSYSQVRAVGEGCVHIVPLQDRTTLSYAFASDRLSDDDALRTLSIVSPSPLDANAVAAALDGGRLAQGWLGNCVAIGEAACVFDPLDNVASHALQLSLVQLLALFPNGADMHAEAAEYNRIIGQAFDRMQDFQSAHYRLNGKAERGFWDRARSEAVSDQLAYRLEIFEATAELPMLEGEVFNTDSWLACLLGNGLIPRTFAAIATTVPDPDLIEALRDRLALIGRLVTDMPAHDVFIELNCEARAPAVG